MSCFKQLLSLTPSVLSHAFWYPGGAFLTLHLCQSIDEQMENISVHMSCDSATPGTAKRLQNG